MLVAGLGSLAVTFDISVLLARHRAKLSAATKAKSRQTNGINIQKESPS